MCWRCRISRPVYQASVENNEAGDRCRLAGPTCLAGDVIGDYTFARPLQEGDLVLFGDMAIYTTCKNNTFNGMPLPNIWKLDSEGGDPPDGLWLRDVLLPPGPLNTHAKARGCIAR